MDSLEDISDKVVVYYRRKPYQLLDVAKTPSAFKAVIDLNNATPAESNLRVAIIETQI